MTEILSNLLGQMVEFEMRDAERGMIGLCWAVYDTSRNGPALVVEIVDPAYSSYRQVGDLTLVPVADGIRIVTQCPLYRPGVPDDKQPHCRNRTWLSKGTLAEHLKIHG